MEIFNYDVSQPLIFIELLFLMFLIISGRYLVISSVFYFFFYKIRKKQWQNRKVGTNSYSKEQIQKDIGVSIINSFIFSLIGVLTVLAWQNGITSFYLEIAEYGWIYIVASLFLIMLIHETYYYFLHRFMHHPKVYKIIHKTHHYSITPSPFTAFSFHPIEGILQAIILPLLILFIPIHYSVLVVYLFIMTFSSIINHLDIEIYPKGFEKHMIGKWLIGSTHHSLHHSQFRYNYGLYFTFWDKLLKTESPDFIKKIKSKVS